MPEFNRIYYGPWHQNDDSKEGLSLRDAGAEPVSPDFIAKLNTIQQIAAISIFDHLVLGQYGPFMDMPCRTCQDPIPSGICFIFYEDKGERIEENEWKEEYQHYMIKHNIPPTPEFEVLVDNIFNTFDLQRFHAPKINCIHHELPFNNDDVDADLNKKPVSDAFLKALDMIEEIAKAEDDKNLLRFDRNDSCVCLACDGKCNETIMLFLENKEEVLDIHVWTHENRHLMTEHNVQPTPEFEALVQKISNTYKLG